MGLLGHPLAAQEIRKAEAVGDVVGVETCHLAKQLEGLSLRTSLPVGLRGALELASGVGEQRQTLVELTEPNPDLGLILVKLENLLVDGNCLRLEPLLREVGRDLGVGLNGLRGVSLSEKEVADAEAYLGVMRIRLKDLLVLVQGLVELALLGVLGRLFQRLSFVD